MMLICLQSSNKMNVHGKDKVLASLVDLRQVSLEFQGRIKQDEGLSESLV